MRRKFNRAPGLILSVVVVAMLGLVAIPLRTIAQDATSTPETLGLQIGPTATATEAGSGATATSGGLVIGLPSSGTPATGVHGNSYTSPTYGFTLTWPSSWHVVSESSTGGVDQLKLSDGTMTVLFATATTFQGDLARCRTASVAKLAATTGVSDAKPATDPQGKPLAGSDASRDWAVYLYNQGGKAMAQYIDCRTLVPDKANLVITADVALDKFNTESSKLVALLDKLSISGAGPSTAPAATAQPEETATVAPAETPTEAAATEAPATEAASTAQLPVPGEATAEGTTGPISTPVFPVQTTSTPGALPTEAGGQPQATGTEDLSALGVHGNSYKSPSYGYTLSWDSSWTVGDATSSRGGSSGLGSDQLTLYNDASAMTITGAQDFNGDAKTCVTQVASGIKQGQSGETVSEFKTATGSDGKPLTGSSATSAWGVFTYTRTQSGQSQKVANYIECRTLVPGQSVLVIVQDVAQSDYNSQIAPRQKILDSIKIPANPGGTKTPELGTVGVAPNGGEAAKPWVAPFNAITARG